MTNVVPSALSKAPSAPQPPTESTTSAFWERLLVAVIVLAWSATFVADFRTALGLLMAIGFGLAAIGLRYPRFGLLGVGMLCTLNEMAAPLLLNAGGVWRWNAVNYWLLLVALVFSPRLLRLGRWQSRTLLAFTLLLGSELFVSPDVESGLQAVFAIVAAFGLLIYFRRVGHDVEAWYWLGVVSGVLAAGAGAAFLLQQGWLPDVNANVWSRVPLTGMLAICLAFVATVRAPRHGLALALLAVVNGLWVFLSGSRGNMLVAVVCLVFLLAMMPPRRALLFTIVAALISLLVVSQFTMLEEKAVGRLRLLADPSKSLRTRVSGRADLALGAWYMFRDHPFGVGTGGFSTTWTDLGPREGMTGFHRFRWTAAHSGWMKVLAENGFPGIALLSVYVLSFAASGWRTRTLELRWLGSAVTAVLAVAWVSADFQSKAFWLFAAGGTELLERHAIWSARRLGRSVARG